MPMSAKRRSDALAIIVGGARPKGRFGSDGEGQDEKEEGDSSDEGGAMALQSAVKSFFESGNDGDHKAAAKAFRSMMDICAHEEE